MQGQHYIFVHAQVKLIKNLILIKGNKDKNFPSLVFTLKTKDNSYKNYNLDPIDYLFY